MISERYSTPFQVAVDAVRQAARVCVSVQNEITESVLEKKDKSPVTVADYGSQALVCKALRAAFPNDPIIAEEDSAQLREPGNEALLERVVQHVGNISSGADSASVCEWIDAGRAETYSDRFWTLDPIDGTKGFLRKEQYAVALALIEGGEVKVAALACPGLSDGTDRGFVFAAVAGEGAWRLPLFGEGRPRQIHTARNSDPEMVRFCESVESGHSAHGDSARIADRLGIVAEPLRMDSQAKYAAVASGMADIYLRLPTSATYVEKIWDHAAGMLIVTEAGGTVTDIAGKPLDFTHGRGLTENRGVIATNGPLHQDVLTQVTALGLV